MTIRQKTEMLSGVPFPSDQAGGGSFGLSRMLAELNRQSIRQWGLYRPRCNKRVDVAGKRISLEIRISVFVEAGKHESGIQLSSNLVFERMAELEWLQLVDHLRSICGRAIIQV